MDARFDEVGVVRGGVVCGAVVCAGVVGVVEGAGVCDGVVCFEVGVRCRVPALGVVRVVRGPSSSPRLGGSAERPMCCVEMRLAA